MNEANIEDIYEAGFDELLQRDDLIEESGGDNRYNFVNEAAFFNQFDQNHLKAELVGEANINSGTSITLNHNLGYIPVHLCFVKQNDEDTFAPITNFSLDFVGSNGFTGFDAGATENQITFSINQDITAQSNDPIDYPVTFKYFLYQTKITDE